MLGRNRKDSIEKLGEFGLIDRLRTIMEEYPSDELLLGPGDDAAIIRMEADRALVLTVDSMTEGRHFTLDNHDPHRLGRRLASVNLSDIAAMGGTPKWALINLSAPGDLDLEFVEELYRGLTSRLHDFGTVLAGGNTTRSDRLVLDLFLIGEVHPDRFLRRDTAESGDGIYVTGSLGCSEAGRQLLKRPELITTAHEQLLAHHLDPNPRLDAGRALSESGLRIAALDISDGITSDLVHLTSSKDYLGAIIEMEKLPLLHALQQAAQVLELSPEDLALSGGEDFELLFTLPEDVSEEKLNEIQHKTGVEITRIGAMNSSGKIEYVQPDGSRYYPTAGWDHFIS